MPVASVPLPRRLKNVDVREIKHSPLFLFNSNIEQSHLQATAAQNQGPSKHAQQQLIKHSSTQGQPCLTLRIEEILPAFYAAQIQRVQNASYTVVAPCQHHKMTWNMKQSRPGSKRERDLRALPLLLLRKPHERDTNHTFFRFCQAPNEILNMRLLECLV